MRRAFIVCVCAALTGCSALTPPPSTTTSNEVPPRPAPRQRARGAEASAIRAVRRFASAYINWTAPTITADMRSLAAQSIGQARSVVQIAAANTAQDYELRQGGIANGGTVEGIAPLPGEPNRYVVVTLEHTTASNTNAYQGLRPAWHVAVATVTEVKPGGWVVSGWQPES